MVTLAQVNFFILTDTFNMCHPSYESMSGGNQGLTDELLATIAQEKAIAFDPMIQFPFLGEVILDLKQISEVSCCIHAHGEINRLVFVIEDC